MSSGRRVLIWFLVSVLVIVGGGRSVAAAQGWTEFEIELADDYTINVVSAGVVLTKCSKLVVDPTSFDGVGEIVGFIETDSEILLMCPVVRRASVGRGDVHVPGQFVYFVVERESSVVDGPLDQSSFESHPAVPSQIDSWKRPTLPLPWQLWLIAGLVMALFGLPVGVLVVAVVYAMLPRQGVA